MSTYPTLDLSELAAGHDGPQIPESKRIYFQERWKYWQEWLEKEGERLDEPTHKAPF